MTKWKVFSWLLLIASIGGIIFNVSQGMIGTQFVISSVLSVLLLIPYFGVAYQKKMAVLLLWKVTFIIQAIFLVMLVAFFVIGQLSYVAGDGGMFDGLLEIIIFFFIALLLLVPPYIYAFKSSSLWSENV